MKYVKIFTNFLEDISTLEDDEIGRLFVGMLRYAEDGEQPSLPGNERFLWGVVRRQVDIMRSSYEHRCEVNKTNRDESSKNQRIVTNRDESSQEEEEEEEEKKKRYNRRFTPPTYTEVEEYCSSSGLSNVDPHKFCDFYASKNWLVGKSKMRDWKAACRNWNRTDRKKTDSHSNYEQRKVEDKDFADLFLDLNQNLKGDKV